jgi:hypothetical protein
MHRLKAVVKFLLSKRADIEVFIPTSGSSFRLLFPRFKFLSVVSFSTSVGSLSRQS